MSRQQAQFSLGYQLFILVLSLMAIAAITMQTFGHLDSEIDHILQQMDTAICAIFFLDFLLCLWRAPDRWRYFYTTGWLDLISSIPTLDLARWGRLAQVGRIIRVLRLLRAARIITKIARGPRGQNSFFAATLLALLVLACCSIAVLHFESPEGNIKSGEDALWWAFTTITTVGYGDRYPVTSEGRFIAGILMVVGVGLFSTFSGLLAAWFLAPEARREESEISVLRQEISALRVQLSQLNPPAAAAAAGSGPETAPSSG